ncbi:MAG: DUF2065 family protein [Halopseudomonas yangmingensis]|uniref:DUF2065 domain-containing protein n=1 Tax=Halopseudomonas yangmingensis TaxID=1720063 RepID=A0A1I4PQZ1_9GAMM|nr:DUF2065 family protein [Halopseudomonas yangmingensis]SFM30252.1 hypothetical protein SAMN05216217_10331 [Halopseudomonas yangmingensis]
MWQELAIAVCLLLVLEGLMPFLAPRYWKRMLASVAAMDERSLRVAGLIAMLTGTGLLYLIR